MQKTQLLLNFNLLFVAPSKDQANKVMQEDVSTIISNFAFYGFIPNQKVVEAIQSLSKGELVSWWKDVEEAIRIETGASVEMDRFVVYKNFPEEVLAMSEAQYWMNQSLIYSGVDVEFIAESEDERPQMSDSIKLKVLSLTQNMEKTQSEIFEQLKVQKSAWNDKQLTFAKILNQEIQPNLVSTDFGFKDNFIILAVKSDPQKLTIVDATDVLRFAAALSKPEGPFEALSAKTKFKKFSRPERKLLLSLMEKTKNLAADAASRKTLFKIFFSLTHPGDYSFDKVKEVYDSLYKGNLKSFASKVETSILSSDESVVELLKTRPGEYLRRFSKLYATMDNKLVVVQGLIAVIPKLSTLQLLKLEKIVSIVRNDLIYPPKGNWTKAQFVKNDRAPIARYDQIAILSAIETEISSRLNKTFPNGIDLDENTKKVRLATNDQKLANYGRGTVFSIPENVKTLRTASYWKSTGANGTVWFDNGFNFYHEDWTPVGTICWNSTSFAGAVFSGDPVNTTEMQGRACQMIDLNLDELAQRGVRYAVWNILAFSNIPFSKVDDVMATLQFCEDATVGGLYEPSRAEMVFPLVGENKTKYIAVVDIKTREVVYWDANLKGNVGSATSNQDNGDKFKAYSEYLQTLPSVYDLFKYAKFGSTPVLFSDESVSIKDGDAYVFKPSNTENDYKQISLSELLE